MKRLTMLGGGAWGCAVAHHFAQCGFEVLIWVLEDFLVDEINIAHINSRYLPGLELNQKVRATQSMQEALAFSTLIAEAVPVVFLRSVLEHAKPFVTPQHQWLVLSKGIETGSMSLPSDLIANALGFIPELAVLAGPTFARDLVEKELSAATLASTSPTLRAQLVQEGSNYYCSLMPSDDVIGVQLAGAVKNVVALAVGIARGAECKDNTVALLMTLGLAEMSELLVYFGGKRETILTVAGVGDTVLTCTGLLSKNLRAGTLLGQGRLLEEVRYQLGTLPEGLNTVKALHELMEREGLDFPLVRAVYEFAFVHRALPQFFQAVLQAASSQP